MFFFNLPTGLDDRLNSLALTASDPEFAALVKDGWDWEVVPWYVERLWPEFVDLSQGALNAEHTSFSMASELETASTIAAHVDQYSQDWQTAVDRAKSSMPPCTPYIDAVADFVRNYGGGAGFPIIKYPTSLLYIMRYNPRIELLLMINWYLDQFSRRFEGNRTLGETYWRAVVGMQFQTACTKMPMLRTALLATNLVSPKVVDGISRCLVKSDLLMLQRKDRLMQVTAAETILADAWDTLQSRDVDDAKKCKLFGCLSSRIILFLSKKQKDGPENSSYKSFAEIKRAFDHDLVMENTEAIEPGAAANKAKSTEDSKSTHELSDLSDPKFIAVEAGFKVNAIYMHRPTGKLYNLESMDAVAVTFRETCLAHQPGGSKLDTISIAYDELKSWSFRTRADFKLR